MTGKQAQKTLLVENYFNESEKLQESTYQKAGLLPNRLQNAFLDSTNLNLQLRRRIILVVDHDPLRVDSTLLLRRDI